MWKILQLSLLLLCFSSFPVFSQNALWGISQKEETLRSGPSSEFDRIGILPEGVYVEILFQEKEYSKIKLSKIHNAWVETKALKIIENPPKTYSYLKEIRISQDKINFYFSNICPYQILTQNNPPALYLNLYQSASCVMETIYPREEGLIKEISLQESAEDYLKFKIDFNLKEFWGYDVKFKNNQLEISFKVPPVLDKEKLKNLTVILDPGHGGSDPGAIGANGLKEKEVNLKIAQNLKEILENSGAKVIMTRFIDCDVASAEADAYEELAKRVEIGKSAQGIIFISIHHNARPTPEEGKTATGTYVYFYQPQSKALAQIIAKNLALSIGEKKYAYIQRSFHVIRQTYMPAVLIEVAFISNPQEEKKLNDFDFLKKAAYGIFQGINEFFQIMPRN